MSKPVEVDIALGILDHQLVDADGVNCGKVDDLELTGLDGDSPEVVEISSAATRGARAGCWDGSPHGSRARPCTSRGPRSSRFRPS